MTSRLVSSTCLTLPFPLRAMGLGGGGEVLYWMVCTGRGDEVLCFAPQNPLSFLEREAAPGLSLGSAIPRSAGQNKVIPVFSSAGPSHLFPGHPTAPSLWAVPWCCLAFLPVWLSLLPELTVLSEEEV